MIIICSSKDIYSDFIHNSINEYLSWLDAEYDNNFLNNINIDYCINKYKELPKIIVILEVCNKIKELRKTYPDAKIVTYTNDIHYFDNEGKNVKIDTYTNSDYLVAYYNKFKRFYSIDKPTLNIPHNCCSIFKRDTINQNAIKKIFFYGHVGYQYPLREEFIQYMKSYKNSLIIKSHPGYFFKTKEQALEESRKTSNELNSYFCSFTCGLFPIFEQREKETDSFYLIGKFFEIMGNGVLLLCNDYKVKEQLEELGYYRNQHYIHIDKHNFDTTLKFLFDDKNSNEILEIRKRAHIHTIENYYSVKLNRRLNEFLLRLDKNEDVNDLVVNSN